MFALHDVDLPGRLPKWATSHQGCATPRSRRPTGWIWTPRGSPAWTWRYGKVGILEVGYVEYEIWWLKTMWNPMVIYKNLNSYFVPPNGVWLLCYSWAWFCICDCVDYNVSKSVGVCTAWRSIYLNSKHAPVFSAFFTSYSLAPVNSMLFCLPFPTPQLSLALQNYSHFPPNMCKSRLTNVSPLPSPNNPNISQSPQKLDHFQFPNRDMYVFTGQVGPQLLHLRFQRCCISSMYLTLHIGHLIS